jgi:glucose/arabinose dehydrogenase
MRRLALTLALGAALAAACAQATQQAPLTERLVNVPAPDRELAESLLDAEQVVAARLVQVAEAEQYERPGELVFGIAGAKAPAARAFQGELRVDSTLLGPAARTLQITFFAARGAKVPRQDSTALWVLHRRTLWRLKECAERQAVTSTGCIADQGLALDSDSDVRPLADWAHLKSLIATLGLDARRR